MAAGNEQQPVSKVTRHDEDLLIPVVGETVAATRYEPVDIDGPLPVLLCYTPYRKDDRSFWKYHPYVTYLAAHGYEVVVADLVGTGASSGIKPGPFRVDEGDQGVELVKWLADQEWCDGRIGMFGHSYPGMCAIRTAIKKPEELKAIVTLYSAYTTYERDGVLSSSLISGGSVGYQSSMQWIPMMQAALALPPRRRATDDGRWANVWNERLDQLSEQPPWLSQYLDHESPRDEYWENQDMTVEEIQQVEVPHFAVGGFRDTYVHPVTKFVQMMNGPTRLLLGPWRHTIPNDGRETTVDFYSQMLEWFDHFVKGEDTGALDHPPVSYWTERDGGGQIEGGVWRGTDVWPEIGVGAPETLSFAFSSDGLVQTTEFSDGEVAAEYEYDHTVGIDSLAREGPPVDTNADDARSLCFETPPLEDAVELTGTGEATIRLTATTTDPIVAVRVNDISPDGSASLVTYSHIRASHRESHGDPSELVPGREYEVTIPLSPNSHVFEEGHQIRVAISAAYFPYMLPTDEHGSFTVLSTPEEPSHISFPGRVHEDVVVIDDEISVERPAEETGTEAKQNQLGTAIIETTREHHNDTATFRKQESNLQRLPFADFRIESEKTATVKSDDPSSAAFVNNTTFELVYSTETYAVDVSTRVSRDTAEIDTVVTVGDQTVMSHTWRR